MEFLYYRPSGTELVIAICVGAFLLIQILYYFLICGKFVFKSRKSFAPKETSDDQLPPISVVIATKNEQYFLKENLALFLEQEYPKFEVIVVNDASTDETEYILKAFSKLYPHLKVVNIVENVNKFNGKKFPISLGIKSAKYDCVILSGADCEPSGFNWLRSMASRFGKNKGVVIGYVGYKKAKGFRNLIMQYDNATESMNYLSLALWGLPYRGNGKNLAYRKDAFFKVGGFIKHYNLTLGEDDIFVSQIASSKNTAVALDTDSFLCCQPKRTYKEWKTEKKRRYITRSYYKVGARILLSLLPISSVFIYLGLVLLLLLGVPYPYLILLLVIKFAIQIIAYFKACRRLGIKIIAIFAPLFEIYFLVFNAKIRLVGLFTKKARWK